MKFGEMLEQLQNEEIADNSLIGELVAYREGWNGVELGKEMYMYVRHNKIDDKTNTIVSTPTGTKKVNPFLCLVTGDKVTYGWLASQPDMLSDDWVVKNVVEYEKDMKENN